MKRHNYVYYLSYGPYPVPIVFAPSKKGWNRVHKKFGFDDPDFPEHGRGHCRYRYEPELGSIILMTFNPKYFESNLEVISTIVHECVHALQFLKMAIGEDNPGMEFEAYTVQSMVRQVVGAYEEVYQVDLTAKEKK